MFLQDQIKLYHIILDPIFICNASSCTYVQPLAKGTSFNSKLFTHRNRLVIKSETSVIRVLQKSEVAKVQPASTKLATRYNYQQTYNP